MLDSISFLSEHINITCHSLNILSIDSNFIHLCMFFYRMGNLEKSKAGKALM